MKPIREERHVSGLGRLGTTGRIGSKNVWIMEARTKAPGEQRRQRDTLEERHDQTIVRPAAKGGTGRD